MRKGPTPQEVARRRIRRAAINLGLGKAEPNDLEDAKALGRWVNLLPKEIQRAEDQGTWTANWFRGRIRP